MEELEDIRTLLEQYISPMLARSMLQKALRERDLTPERFRRGDAYRIGPALQRGIALFAGDLVRDRALRELTELCERTQPLTKPSLIQLRSEDDIAIARSEARQICEEMGASSYALQKVTTIASELARNIISYASLGTLEVAPIDGHERRIVVRAEDSGPGIPNLELVLSGRYRSKTGLGRGLFGTKRLADSFDVDTGADGTLVVAEVIV